MCELAARAIESSEPSLAGADPQVARSVFEYRGDDVVRDTSCVVRSVVVVFEERPLERRDVQPIEPTIGADP